MPSPLTVPAAYASGTRTFLTLAARAPCRTRPRATHTPAPLPTTGRPVCDKPRACHHARHLPLRCHRHHLSTLPFLRQAAPYLTGFKTTACFHTPGCLPFPRPVSCISCPPSIYSLHLRSFVCHAPITTIPRPGVVRTPTTTCTLSPPSGCARCISARVPHLPRAISADISVRGDLRTALAIWRVALMAGILPPLLRARACSRLPVARLLPFTRA